MQLTGRVSYFQIKHKTFVILYKNTECVLIDKCRCVRHCCSSGAAEEEMWSSLHYGVRTFPKHKKYLSHQTCRAQLENKVLNVPVRPGRYYGPGLPFRRNLPTSEPVVSNGRHGCLSAPWDCGQCSSLAAAGDVIVNEAQSFKY